MNLKHFFTSTGLLAQVLRFLIYILANNFVAADFTDIVFGFATKSLSIANERHKGFIFRILLPAFVAAGWAFFSLLL
jgi:hypothetical protein